MIGIRLELIFFAFFTSSHNFSVILGELSFASTVAFYAYCMTTYCTFPIRSISTYASLKSTLAVHLCTFIHNTCLLINILNHIIPTIYIQFFNTIKPSLKTMISLPKSSLETLYLSYFQDSVFRFFTKSAKFTTFPHPFRKVTLKSLKSDISKISSAGTSPTVKSVSFAMTVKS